MKRVRDGASSHARATRFLSLLSLFISFFLLCVPLETDSRVGAGRNTLFASCGTLGPKLHSSHSWLNAHSAAFKPHLSWTFSSTFITARFCSVVETVALWSWVAFWKRDTEMRSEFRLHPYVLRKTTSNMRRWAPENGDCASRSSSGCGILE